MRLCRAVRGMSLLAALLLTSGVAACSGAAPPPAAAPGTPSAPPDPDDDARAMLAARAALAQDHRFAALYHFDVPGAPQHNVVATVANDGSWRVDIAAGALGGTADVSIVSTADGVYQCSLPSVANPVGPNCVRVADPGKRVPEPYDPKVERLFRTWLSVFTDRQSALSVTAAGPLPGSQGNCFSIDSISASLNPPVDVGIYCFTADGLLTAARVGFGVLTIASTPVTPPAKVDLPGPVSSDPPMSMASPPPPPVVSVAPSA